MNIDFVMYLNLSYDNINSYDLSKYLKYVDWHTDCVFFTYKPGNERYQLLHYLASVLPEGSMIADVGTYRGYSSVALATANSKNTVITYDIEDCLPSDKKTCKDLPNVVFKLMNCFDDMETILKAKLISLDIDPHDGIQEKKFMDILKANNYKGIVVFDDIYLNMGMNQFWKSLECKKYDVTPIGHMTGTGLIIPEDYSLTSSSCVMTVV
jgi:hypothetical protein